MSHGLAALVVITLAAVTVLGDYFLKLASEHNVAFGNRWFFYGAACYVASAMGWVFAMRHMKLAEIAVIYSLSGLLMLAAVGYWMFGERLEGREMAGVGLAMAAMLLLARAGH